MFRAALLGAVSVLFGCLVLAFSYGAAFGARVPWGELASGWQGGVNVVVGLVYLGPLLFPLVAAVAAGGAAGGVVVWKVTRRGR